MKRTPLDKNGLLKVEKALFASNLFTLALNITSLVGIFVAIILDKSKAAPYDIVLTTAGISFGIGSVGVAGAIATNVVEEKIEKKKVELEAGSTPAEKEI